MNAETPRGLTLLEAADHMMKTNPRFAVSEAEVRGIHYKVFANSPPTIPSMLRTEQDRHGPGGSDDYLIFEEERWTYREFVAEIDAMASALQSRFNVQKGTRVAIAMRNLPELLILFMAVANAGGVAVLLNGWWTREELDYALGDCEAKLVFADGLRLERLLPISGKHGATLVGVREAEDVSDLKYSALLAKTAGRLPEVVEIDTDDDFAIMYSSGTTGHPKGVVQTHRGAVCAVYSWLMTSQIMPFMLPADQPMPEPPEVDVFMVMTPLFHVTATHPLFLLSIAWGARLVVLPKWDADHAVEMIDREKVTRITGVPTQNADLLAASKRLGSTLPTLTFFGSGGAKRPPAQVQEIHDAFGGRTVASGWGMTETNAIGIGIAGPTYLQRPDAAGQLYPPLQQLRILDDDGNELANGEVGELTVKSVSNMRCYLNKPDATAEVLQDGWLRTGDLARVDDEGFVTIVDRKKNIIIRGGENISCLDVEAAIHRHPAVAEACVFSMPDERLGEVVGAGVQLRTGMDLDTDALATFLEGQIAKFKIPVRVWFQYDPLPRAATDKPDRKGLRAHCLGPDAG